MIVTARDREADRLAGFDLGADDYVTKPFSVRELVARVNANLRRSAQPQREAATASEDELLVGGNIELDSAAHEARVAGRSVKMSPKELALLEYLMRRAGRTCPRDAIVEEVWGLGFPGRTRTVDVHMRWLREKLETEPSQPRHLVTVRGIGNKFVP